MTADPTYGSLSPSFSRYRQHRVFCLPPYSCPYFPLSPVSESLECPYNDSGSVDESISEQWRQQSGSQAAVEREVAKLEQFRTQSLLQLKDVRKRWVDEIDRATMEIEGILDRKCEEMIREMKGKTPGENQAWNLDLSFDLTPIDLNMLIKQFVNISLEYTPPELEVKTLYKFFGGLNSACTFDILSEKQSESYHCTDKFLHNSSWLVVPSGEVYITGGSLMGKSKADVTVFYPWNGNTKEIIQMWSPRRSHSMAFLEDILYVFGGIQLDQKTSLCESFDLSHSRWSLLPMMPTPRAYHGSTVFRRSIYIAGGSDQSGIDIFTPDLSSYSYVSLEGWKVTEACSIVSTEDSLILFHGNYQGEVLQYHPDRKALQTIGETGYGNSWSSCPPICIDNTVYTLKADTVYKFDLGRRQCEYVCRMAKACKKRRCGEGFQ